jgi:hypothetical protein
MTIRLWEEVSRLIPSPPYFSLYGCADNCRSVRESIRVRVDREVWREHEARV